MKIKKLFHGIYFILLLLVFSNTNSFSQSKSADTLKPKNSLEKGAWAVQFGIDKDFTVTNFSGASFTIKRHFSKNIALRFGTGMYFVDSDQTVSNQYDTTFYSIGENRNDNEFNFNLLMIYYFNPNKEFNMYGLAGPVFSYGFGKSSNYDENHLYNQTYKSISAGGQFGFGAEYFIFKSFSVFAEYNAEVVSRQENYYLNDIQVDNNFSASINSERTVTSFSFNKVRFGLSVYF